MLLVSPKDVDQQAVKRVSGMEVVTLPAVGLQRGGEIAFAPRIHPVLPRGGQALQVAPAAGRPGDGRLHQRAADSGRQAGRGARTFLHESNTIPGRANRWLSRVVHRAFVGFPTAAGRLHNRNVTVTGTPVRACFQRPRDRRMPGQTGP